MNDGRSGEIALERGILLFNANDYFHAHEVWEDWWRATTHPEKQTIQGMIQIAVAMYHASTGNLPGAISVMERGLRNLEPAGGHWRGVNLQRLQADGLGAIRQLRAGQPVTHFRIVSE